MAEIKSWDATLSLSTTSFNVEAFKKLFVPKIKEEKNMTNKFDHEGKILIMVDEKDPNKVIARDLITKKTAEAKCNPKDEWDFAKGAKLALERLYLEKKEEEKPKYWSGKVVCIYTNHLSLHRI